MTSTGPRLAVDIGGTFTDIVLEINPGEHVSGKYLTTHDAPERAVLEGAADLMAKASISPTAISVVLHGTTLATNALIERKGAKVALISTAGFRDSIEIAHEFRFAVHDINMQRPEPLVPRHLRLEVTERMAADGSMLIPLDEQSVHDLVPVLKAENVDAVAICLMHSYLDGTTEKRVSEILTAALPGVRITLSHEICPEIREYERASTACANAYVQPMMESYLGRLQDKLRALGVPGPLMLMTSNGGLCTVDMACAQPVRLVESGPAGGALLASRVAAQNKLKEAIAFDMGGTTAKLVLIDEAKPHFGRLLEVARVYRFLKGSGIPLRIPVIDLVEIGAGGGSIGHVDEMGRIAVGPESLGSEPGPACYGRGATQPGVTDADLVLGKIDPDGFAGGKMTLDRALSESALEAEIGSKLNIDTVAAANGMIEMVDENMANAARVHATDNGKELEGRTMIAFGGAAPLHAARIAQKLDISEIIIPRGAGVGSAYGFLLAPVSYEAVRTRLIRFRDFDTDLINGLFDAMAAEARAVVELAAPGKVFVERRMAYMRYTGQGHEIAIPLESRPYTLADADLFKQMFEVEYGRHYTRPLPNMQVEALTWTLELAEAQAAAETAPDFEMDSVVAPDKGERPLFDFRTAQFSNAKLYSRFGLKMGARVEGPSVIAEDETTTVVPAGFNATINGLGQIVLRKSA